MKSGFQVALRIKFLDFPRMSICKSEMRGLENKIKYFQSDFGLVQKYCKSFILKGSFVNNKDKSP